MSKEINKAVVKAAQEYLASIGIAVKPPQIYEMFARLAGHKNWNVASNAGANFSKVLPTVSEVERAEEIEIEEFLKKRTDYRDRLVGKLKMAGKIKYCETVKSKTDFVCWHVFSLENKLIFLADSSELDLFGMLVLLRENEKEIQISNGQVKIDSEYCDDPVYFEMVVEAETVITYSIDDLKPLGIADEFDSIERNIVFSNDKLIFSQQSTTLR